MGALLDRRRERAAQRDQRNAQAATGRVMGGADAYADAQWQDAGTASAAVRTAGPAATVGAARFAGRPAADQVAAMQRRLGAVADPREAQYAALRQQTNASLNAAGAGSRSAGMRGGLAAGANTQAAGAHLAGTAAIEGQYAQMMEDRLGRNMALAGQIGSGNQSSVNAANQFNAGARNDLSQFNAGLVTQGNQFNAGQANTMSQFNAQGRYGADRARRDDYLGALGAEAGRRSGERQARKNARQQWGMVGLEAGMKGLGMALNPASGAGGA